MPEQNIGPRERRRRRTLGYLALILALLLSGFMIARGTPTVYRYALFPIYLTALLGLMQARQAT